MKIWVWVRDYLSPRNFNKTGPGDEAKVQATLGGLRRELAKPKKCKELVAAEMLLAIQVEVIGPSPSLTEVQRSRWLGYPLP